MSESNGAQTPCQLETREFEGHPIRTTHVDGEQLWVVRDLCEGVGRKRPHLMVRGLDPSEYGMISVETEEGFSEVLAVRRSGLLKILKRLRKSLGSHAFVRWMTEQFLDCMTPASDGIKRDAARKGLTASQPNPLSQERTGPMTDSTNSRPYDQATPNGNSEVRPHDPSQQIDPAFEERVAPSIPHPDSPHGWSSFDAIRHEDAEGEYWLARELMPYLGYKNWQNFILIIEKAKQAFDGVGIDHSDMVIDVSNHVPRGFGEVPQAVHDVRLNRRACYMVAICGDPRKPEVAAAKHYFVIKTRQAETMSASPPPPGMPPTGMQEFVDFMRAFTPMMQSMGEMMRRVVGALDSSDDVRATLADYDMRFSAIEDRLPPPGYATLVSFVRFKGLRNVEDEELRNWGGQLKSYCRKLGIETKPVEDGRWGIINSYPIRVIEDTFERFGPREKGSQI